MRLIRIEGEFAGFAFNALLNSHSCRQAFKYFSATEIFEKSNLLQTTVDMCKTVHNNMSLTTIEQKIVRYYLEAYLILLNSTPLSY